nr:receptor-like protein kinase HAIKU2 [Ipomoea batatas]
MAAGEVFRPNHTFPFLLCFFTLFFFVATSDELQSLLALKASFQNAGTGVFDNWNSSTPPCNFAGITCNSDGLVREIELSGQGLFGSIPFDSICSLGSLEKLALGYNSLSGRISDDLNKCVGLKYLDLGNNLFSGSIPDMSALSELTYLYMNRSGFSGKFPWNSLENVTNLEVLSIGDNPFEKTLFPEVITKLTRLNWLYLSNCSLEGKIPEGIGNLTELIDLELSMNYLSGGIPAGISNLRKLWQLELYSNYLTGKLPAGFGNLTNLEFLDASTNYLYGDLSEIRHLTQLVSLQLLENHFSGEVPAELGEFKKLVNLSLYTNNLSGHLPSKLGSWAEFDFIDVSENLFTGPIPAEMCKQGKMRGLLILQNNFTGEIPDNYVNCKTLRRFRVSKNSLSGKIPSGIWALPNADIIDISNNGFEGSISSDIGLAKSLSQLFLQNNKLSGDLPPEISGASLLFSIDLSNNKFSGEIPATIGELKRLDSLHLQNNNFIGSIPETLGSCVELSDITIAKNSLTGPIPATLGFLPTLTSLNLSDNHLSGQIPGTLSSLKLNLLDLSNNQLSGPIPDSLSIAAYNGSFAGNHDLCSNNINNFRRCSKEFDKSYVFHTILLCLMAACITILVSLGCFVYLKKKKSNPSENHELSLKKAYWNVKSFHILSFEEDEILDAIKTDNLIGKGGSGNVYRVVVGNGTELAVKHIWNSDVNGRRNPATTTPILRKRAAKSKEFEAEVQTLSSIRHVNVVKLYCSITSEDSKYGYTNKVNEKSDVYSFGVVLMELVLGKRPSEAEYGENNDIVSWVSSKLYSKESVLNLVDSEIRQPYKEDAIEVLRIAVMCTARLPSLRPSMRTVVKMLEDAQPCNLLGIVVCKQEC